MLFRVCPGLACFLLLSACAPNVTSAPRVPTSQTVTPQAFSAMLARVNAARQQGANCGSRGVFQAAPPLTWNTRLSHAAQVQANDMARNQFFSHAGSDGSDVTDRVSATGYAWALVGENLAYGSHGYFDATSVVDSWLSSDGHCANIMNPEFTELGAAKQTDATYDYWAQVLATPQE